MKKLKLKRDQGTLGKLYRVIIEDRRRSKTRRDQGETKGRKNQREGRNKSSSHLYEDP